MDWRAPAGRYDVAVKKVSKQNPVKSTPITLNYAGGRVVVFAEDGDRFMMTARRAARACQQADRLAAAERDRKQWMADASQRFETELIYAVHKWCEERAGRVAECYLALAGRHLDVYVVGSSDSYDFDLGSETSQLELALFDKGWEIHTRLIPKPTSADELRAHFDLDGALLVYADSKPTPGKS